jgi:hypothetical protein
VNIGRNDKATLPPQQNQRALTKGMSATLSEHDSVYFSEVCVTTQGLAKTIPLVNSHRLSARQIAVVYKPGVN